MSVAPTDKLMSSTRSLNASFTSLVISKESGVILVHPDGQKLPENFEYMKPKNFDIPLWKLIGCVILAILLVATAIAVPPAILLSGSATTTPPGTIDPITTVPTTMDPTTTNQATTNQTQLQ